MNTVKRKIRFGTDGWRGRIAEDFTFDNVRIVAQAIADYINSQRKGKTKILIVGYDRRFLSDTYAKTVSSVLAANSIKVFLTAKPSPTPAISFAIKSKALDGGVIITASHNPPEFNGIKFKTALAAPADDDTTKTIESLIGSARPKETDFELALRDKRIRFLDVDNDYIDFLRSYVDIERIKKARHLNILVDYMHGVGAGYIERILGKIAGHIDVIRDSANPLFGGVNPEPIPKNMEHSLELTKRKKIDLGIALDGDADRIGAIRPDGRYITSGQIISLILLHLLEERNLCGAVVKTISGTALLDRICDRFGLSLFETPVGFKHISSLMLRENILIGGEESGGIGFCGYIPERDGILSALLLIEMLAVKNRSIIAIMNGIEKEYGRFCYDRLDISYPQHKANLLSKRLRSNPPHTIAGKKIIKMKTYDGIKFIMQDSSWLLLRFSGTEPLIRIYAESNSEDNVKMLLSAGKKILRY